MTHSHSTETCPADYPATKVEKERKAEPHHHFGILPFRLLPARAKRSHQTKPGWYPLPRHWWWWWWWWCPPFRFLVSTLHPSTPHSSSPNRCSCWAREERLAARQELEIPTPRKWKRKWEGKAMVARSRHPFQQAFRIVEAAAGHRKERAREEIPCDVPRRSASPSPLETAPMSMGSPLWCGPSFASGTRRSASPRHLPLCQPPAAVVGKRTATRTTMAASRGVLPFCGVGYTRKGESGIPLPHCSPWLWCRDRKRMGEGR